MRPFTLGGATFETKEIPMGLSSSSAKVRVRYVPMSHWGTTGSGETVPWIDAGEGWPWEARIIIG